MKFAKLISKEKVLKYAINLIRKSDRELLLTMDLNEELATPLPDFYHQLILDKAKKGIKIRRLGFGKLKDFKLLNKSSPKVRTFTFTYGGSLKEYQRMLIIDRKQAMFRIGDQIIFTDFEPLVLSLVNFFEINYNQRRKLR